MLKNATVGFEIARLVATQHSNVYRLNTCNGCEIEKKKKPDTWNLMEGLLGLL